MSLPSRVSEIIQRHVTLEVEGIDRMYLNAFVPILQSGGGIAHFFKRCHGKQFASSALMQPMTTAFVRAIEFFVEQLKLELVTFEKGVRKDNVAKEHLARFRQDEGFLFVGKAQEKTPVFRTVSRRNPTTGQRYAWLMRSTAMVNNYYFYGVDRDFGPFFVKFCSYFPYNAKLYINGHEYVKRQLDRRGIAYEPLDNGILSCSDPKRLQQICDELSAEKIDAMFRKWLGRIPHPFSAEDREWGCRYELFTLQAEFSLTQVFDRPVIGRLFFEEVIRENLDIGRPDQVQLIFNRRVNRRTPGRFRTRVITDGVIPSLHIDYKRSRIKQYHKEGRALRTETTINDTRDFAVGKRLQNLPALRKVGFNANRRLLDVQTISHDCAIGEDAFRKINDPVTAKGQRASGLRFGETRVQTLFAALMSVCLMPRGFSNRDLRQALAPLLGVSPDIITAGRMTYDLRRLRLHGLIGRIRNTNRYRLTWAGLRSATFFSRIYNRVLRPALSCSMPHEGQPESELATAMARLQNAIDRLAERSRCGA